MKDHYKTETELIDELVKLRKRIAELEAEANQQKCVAEKLREYQKVIESSEDMIAVVDQHYKYLLANPRFLQYRGPDREQVVGRSVPEVLGKDVFEKVVRNHLDACFQGKVVQYEMKYIYPELGERDLLVLYFPIENPEGINRAVIVIRDITERKRVEEEYRTILQTTGDGFWIADMEGRFLDVNDAYCRLIGYNQDELRTMRISDVEAAERPEEIAQRIQRIMKTGGDRFETRHRCKDETIIDIEVSVNYTEVGGGRLFVFLRDITERRRAAEALMQAEERFRSLFNEAPVGYHEVDKEGCITKVNYTELNMLGCTAEEMIGQPIWKFTAEPEKVKRIFEAKIAGDLIPGQAFERIYRRKDGTTLIVIAEDRLFKNKTGGIIGIRTTIQDITDRKRAQEEREKLIQELQDALASIKRLQGLLPICASCKKIRDDKGYWNQIESYIRDHSEAEFSHGICPECFKKLYPDESSEDL